VIDAVGKESIINEAISMVKLGGSVCVYGVIDVPSIRVDKGRGPYNFDLLLHQWPTRARECAAQEPLVEWIRAGRLSSAEFLSAEFPVRAVEDAFALSRSGTATKVLLRF